MTEIPTPSVGGGASRAGWIRTIAIGVLIWQDHLLGQRGYDHVKSETFFRPLGGGIEFGELARAAIVREYREALDRAIEVAELIAVTENLFRFDGTPEHQIVFEFAVDFAAGEEPPDLEPLLGRESDGVAFEARWLRLPEVLDGTHVVYHAGLPQRLTAWLDR